MSKNATISTPCFKLKADFFPMTVLKLNNDDLTAITHQLTDTIRTAPNFLVNAPVVIDVIGLDQTQRVNIKGICKTLTDQKIIPVGIRGLQEKYHATAHEQGLAIIKAAKKPEQQAAPIIQKPAEQKNTDARPTQVITKPVRSGTRIYAKGGDLVVLAAVNAGGECIADGNIHIYGPLRGRALAGAKGNNTARIFCESLEAELISIAGHYRVNENIKAPSTKHPMIQIYLRDDKLIMEGI